MAIAKHSQVLASTHQDAHGERYDKSFLEDMANSMPTRWPLHQRHDMSLPTLGYVSDPRVISDPKSPGHWLLEADVEYDDDTFPPDFQGFSWSATQGMLANCPEDEVEIEIYLPWPLYNNKKEIDQFLGLPAKVGVGKWIKKSISPEYIALINVASAVTTITQPLWYPFWEKYSQDVLYPRIQRIRKGLGSLWQRGMTTDLCPRLTNIDGSECKGYLIPDRARNAESYSKNALHSGIMALVDKIKDVNEQEHRNLRTVKAVYERKSRAYRVFHIEYDDGSTVHFPE